MLSLLIFVPIIGGFIGWFSVIATLKARTALSEKLVSIEVSTLPVMARLKTHLIYHCASLIALLTMLVVLALVAMLWVDNLSVIKTGQSWLMIQDTAWIAFLNIRFHLLLDGFSLVFITLTVILTILTIVYSRKEKHTNIGLYYFCILWMAAGVIGLFMAMDMFLFFLFWEMVAIPLYFLIALWGRRDSSAQLRFNGATKFLIFTQVSSLLMLISIISLVLINWRLTNKWTFDYYLLTKTPISSFTEFFLMLGFFAAFMVRIPLIPFHGWVVTAHIESSTSGSMIISGLLTNTAIYGMLRFVIPMFPNASLAFMPVAVSLGMCTLFYAALLAFSQNDIKRLLAYTHIALLGFITVAIYIGNVLTYQGIIIQTIAMSLSIVGLFIIGGLLAERYLTRNIKKFVGLRGHVRYLPAFTIFFALAVLGVPGTANFSGNLMLLFGSYADFSLVSVLLTIGLILIAVAVLVRMQPIFYGLTTAEPIKIAVIYRELSRRDLFLLITLLILLVAIGVYPQPILDTSYSVIYKIQQFYNTAQPALIEGGV